MCEGRNVRWKFERKNDYMMDERKKERKESGREGNLEKVEWTKKTYNKKVKTARTRSRTKETKLKEE